MRLIVWTCLLALVFTATGCTRSARLTESPATTARVTQTYTDPKDRWSLSYPEGFSLRPFSQEDRVRIWGLWITSFSPDPELSFDPHTPFPADGVALRISYQSGGPLFVPASRDTPFPLSLEDFEATPKVGREQLAHLVLAFQANALSYRAAVWLGEEASPGDRQAIAEVVASIRFPALSEGTVMMRDGSSYHVLGRDSDYPVASVVRFDAEDLPGSGDHASVSFYLVRAPGGLFALGFGHLNRVGGYRGCEVIFEDERIEFACPEIGARWDRLGQVLVNPDPTRHPDDPLQVLLVVVAHDGRVLVSPDWDLGPLDDDLWR